MNNKVYRGIGRKCARAAAALALLCSGTAFGLDVAGPITASTTWSVSQSPYRVTADVRIESGATLTIEPGVTVALEPGVNFSVTSGALRALGTPSAPIRFTSSTDVDGGSPAPGNWGALRFLDGINDPLTILEYVQVRYGQGVVIESASPTLNYVLFENNSGPAVTIDLNSSPVGVGLQASGNSINGILVSAGEITGSVLWGLRGIPYVAEQGTVSVGRAPTISALSPNQIAQGKTERVTVTGSRLAGIESVVFAGTGVTATVLPGGSDTSFTADVTAVAQAAEGPRAVEVQAAAGTARLENAITVVPPLPPIVVSNISPTSIQRGQTLTFQATGTNLAGANVATNAGGLTISNIATTATSVSFTLAAANNAALGDHTFSFSNPAVASGTATAIVTVLEAPPNVFTSPAPVAVPPDNTARVVRVRISRIDSISHTFGISVANTNIATVAPDTVTIAAGQTEANFTVTGRQAGQTVLTLSSPTLGTTTATVFVTTEFTGLNTSFALPLGLVVEQDQTQTPTETPVPLTAAALGVAFGNYVGDISPQTLTIGTGPVPLVISGAGLDAVTAVSILPADGLTLGSPTASADGTSLTVPVTIAADAPRTVRQVVVSAGTARYLPAGANADRIKVVNPPPLVESVVPIFAARGATALGFTVVGKNFQDLQSVTFTPADGIAVGPATVSADGTQVALAVSVEAAAALGPRRVTVTTLGGTSSAVASPANTLTVVNEIQQTLTPIAAPGVGVVVEQEPQPPAPQSLSLASTVIGVTYGSAITAMTPATGVIGETVTLSFAGSDLEGVTAVEFVPATGLTVGSPVVAVDGRSVTVSVAIAADAPQTLRTVQVLAGTQRLTFASPFSAIFRVTPPLPRVDSVSPLYLQIGAPLTTLTVGGANFQNASQVRVLSADGVTVAAAPTVNADGTVVTVSIGALAGAAPGPRVITVVTPAGETTSTPSVANTVTLTTEAGTTFGPFAASLGVVLEEPPAPPPPTTFGPFTAPALGVVLTPTPAPVSVDQFAAALPLGMGVGSFALDLAPAGVLAGQSATLTISGASLDAVTSVTVSPSDGLTVGTASVNGDGTELSVPITVDTAAPPGPRFITLSNASGIVFFSSRVANKFTVVPAIPVISSIEPIFGSQGQVVSLLIRANNLQYATGVSITPADGVAFSSSFSVNAAGTELTIPLSIALDAVPGARAIQVVTPAGSTPATATPANTFTIRSQ